MKITALMLSLFVTACALKVDTSENTSDTTHAEQTEYDRQASALDSAKSTLLEVAPRRHWGRGHRVYWETESGELGSHDVRTGRTLSYAIPLELGPLITSEDLVVQVQEGLSSIALTAYDADSGQFLASRDLSTDGATDWAATAWKDSVYVFTTSDGELQRWIPTTSEEPERVTSLRDLSLAPANIGTLALRDNTLVIEISALLHHIDLTDFSVEKIDHTSILSSDTLAITENGVVFASGGSLLLHAFDTTTTFNITQRVRDANFLLAEGYEDAHHTLSSRGFSFYANLVVYTSGGSADAGSSIFLYDTSTGSILPLLLAPRGASLDYVEPVALEDGSVIVRGTGLHRIDSPLIP